MWNSQGQMYSKGGAFSLCYVHDWFCRTGHLFHAWLSLSFCIDAYISCTHICMYIYDTVSSLLQQEVVRVKLAKQFYILFMLPGLNPGFPLTLEGKAFLFSLL